ncbi:MAG: NYN domain-containing protein [Patescibacteria group bacterium]|nr:NYN domain-containing protein [Patescibacteria group bacterium]
MRYKTQRVGVFIDVQNLYYSAKALYQSRVNFGEVLKAAVAGREVVRAIAYTVKAEMPEEQSFFDALTNLGLEVKSKELQTFVDGSKKADWDVGIAVDVLKLAPKLDAIVICSGDGDFQTLLHHAKAKGCLAEVVSFGRSTSSKLIEEADDVIDMDKDPARFTIKVIPKGFRKAGKRIFKQNEQQKQPEKSQDNLK